MTDSAPTLPLVFKGIALFTPGGDIIYGIDPNKQDRWHTHLCTGLQEVLGLSEPPHFLIPSYTATIDRWRDPKTRNLHTVAECYPPVQRYKYLLNALFGTPNLIWQVVPWQEEFCEPLIVESYRSRFPELWDCHDLIIPYHRLPNPWDDFQAAPDLPLPESPNTYVLRLFISGDRSSTEKTLMNLHKLLEDGLKFPYTLKVIDIFKHPEQAEKDQVSATPTLVRAWPTPVRRIVGELEDTERILKIIATV
ncbi:circadian clock KaiB family protein [Spirulina subsalsa FACHB-351]|uniref:Circadian clock KaiB family protein n=1 Tax=Spirulina subsalsa FACHB-351 TaxID=234711 RepID=A0ABT3LB66_9CYAN|nr:circadian clock KaiB family protein [Spirulina subsalsa]MCW6038743.1 circadian clock KaiB family protein [Spirulina subsalsa FACHB-351]